MVMELEGMIMADTEEVDGDLIEGHDEMENVINCFRSAAKLLMKNEGQDPEECTEAEILAGACYLQALWIPNFREKMDQLKTMPPKQGAIMIYNDIEWKDQKDGG